jgi:hypothetical protein
MSPLKNQATKTQRLQKALLDTNGVPLAKTKMAQNWLLQYDVPLPWAIYARDQRIHHHIWSHIDCEATQVTDPFT